MNAITIVFTVWNASSQAYQTYGETVRKTDQVAIDAIASLAKDPVDGGWEFQSTSYGVVGIDSIKSAHIPSNREVTMDGRYSCD